MIKRIHVDQHAIRRNKREGTNLPPISVKTYKSNDKANEVRIIDDNGNEVAKIIYSPSKPLSCGARVWIETNSEVIIE
jgi:hypothetical protein